MHVFAFSSSSPHSVLGLTVEELPTVLPALLGPWTLVGQIDLDQDDARALGIQTDEALRHIAAQGYHLTGVAALPSQTDIASAPA